MRTSLPSVMKPTSLSAQRRTLALVLGVALGAASAPLGAQDRVKTRIPSSRWRPGSRRTAQTRSSPTSGAVDRS
jgi:hypothetical protein